MWRSKGKERRSSLVPLSNDNVENAYLDPTLGFFIHTLPVQLFSYNMLVCALSEKESA